MEGTSQRIFGGVPDPLLKQWLEMAKQTTSDCHQPVASQSI